MVTASFLGGGVRRLGGFGGALIMSPVFMWIFPVPALVVLVLLAELIGGLLLSRNWKLTCEDKPRRDRLLLFAMCAFPIGIAVGTNIQVDVLRVITNAVIAFFAAYLITNHRRQTTLSNTRDRLVGLLCGGLLGSCGIGGPPAVLYLNFSTMEFSRIRSLMSSFISGISVLGLSMTFFLVDEWLFFSWFPVVLSSYVAGIYVANTLAKGVLNDLNIVKRLCLLIMLGNALLNLTITGQRMTIPFKPVEIRSLLETSLQRS